MRVCSFMALASTLVSMQAAASEPMGRIRLHGYLGTRLDQMIERQVVNADVDYLTACFRDKCETTWRWQTEFWGKWMHSAMPYLGYSASEELKRRIERGLGHLLSSQESNGYIGNYPVELRCGEGWDVWGIKYTMMGLLHYADGVSAEEGGRALKACCRLCDYVIAEIGPGGRRGRELWETGNWSGLASSSILEPVVWLYRRTKDRRYLDFASFIVKGMTEPSSGPRLVDLAKTPVADRNGKDWKPDAGWKYVCKRGRSKAYEMMSCYQGLIDYWEVTGKREFLDAAIATAENIAGEEVNLAGGCACSEAWFHGAHKQHLPYMRLQETCVTVTWMRLCEKLLAVTGDPVWADWIEKAFYNAYLGALRADGSEFSSYTPLSGDRWHGMNHCHMHTDCCSANGPRGFLSFLRAFFYREGKQATFNFYGSAQVDGFEVYSLYPRTDRVRIVSHVSEKLKLRLRIPHWSEKTVAKVNGKPVDDVKAGTYCVIDRDWKLGDIVELEFDMPIVAHVQCRHVAFTRGPVLLARDSRFDDGSLTVPFRAGIRDGQKMDGFNAVRTPSDELWMAYSATLDIGLHAENPEGANPETVFFCDYASAGNAWRRENYYRTWFPVELSPTD